MSVPFDDKLQPGATALYRHGHRRKRIRAASRRGGEPSADGTAHLPLDSGRHAGDHRGDTARNSKKDQESWRGGLRLLKFFAQRRQELGRVDEM